MRIFTQHQSLLCWLFQLILFASVFFRAANANANQPWGANNQSMMASEIKSYFPNLSNGAITQLMHNGYIRNAPSSGERFDLKPQTTLFTDNNLEASNLGNNNFRVEEINYIPIPSLNIPKTASPSHPQLVLIYNALRKVSSLSGLEYYSSSRQKMRTLFKEAYAVESETNTKKIADPIVKTIPSESQIVIFQHDLTFGKNITLATYKNKNNQIALSLTNLSDIRYGIIPFVKKNKMRTSLLLLPIEQGLLIYCDASADTVRLFGLEQLKQDSFVYRLNALANWTKANINLIGLH